MAYEVVKTIGTRQYRYRVQSERDPHTGKTRNRWTYLGRVASERDIAKPRPARSNARLRLLAAAEQLLTGGDAAAVTVDAIAAVAGVAHGTFYRYFRDRSDALEQLARHIRSTRAGVDDALLVDDVKSAEQARAGVRAWIVGRLQAACAKRPALSAWYALIASDARLAAYRDERRASTFARLREHIDALNARGFASVTDSASTATVLCALLDGIMRTLLLERDGLDAAAIAAAADLAERAIFAS